MGQAVAIKVFGSFSKLGHFLQTMLYDDPVFNTLSEYGAQGVAALAAATPQDSGITADSWDFKINRGATRSTLSFMNYAMDDNNQTPIVILLTYGHGTGNGAYVQGRDFINPAIQPIFDQIAEGVWKQVTQA